MNYSGSEEKAEEVVDEIKAIGGKAIAVQANVADSECGSKLDESKRLKFWYT